jgi:hypothetical protein
MRLYKIQFRFLRSGWTDFDDTISIVRLKTNALRIKKDLDNDVGQTAQFRIIYIPVSLRNWLTKTWFERNEKEQPVAIEKEMA